MDLLGLSSIEGEQALRRLLAENRRQTRGLLATIRAMVAQTATTGHSIQDYVALLDGRLGALARAQEACWLEPGRSPELTALIDAELNVRAVDPDRITVSGPRLELSGRVASVLSLALHELIVNAVRFGALGPRGGGVELHWSQTAADERIQLTWREISEVAATAPTSTGFGWELLRKTLPYEIGARVSIRLGWRGLDCAIEFHPQGARRDSL